MKMKTKSFPVRSSHKSLALYPPLPGSREIDPDTYRGERDVRPHKKRQSSLGGSEPLKSDTCVVCEVSDERVSRCSGLHCPIWFHGECLTPEFGGNEDLVNPFCPYCWLQVVSLESKALREKVISAEKAVYKYLDKGIVGEHGECCSSKEDQFDRISRQPEDDGAGMEDDIEPDGEDVSERAAATNVAAQPNTLRNFSFFDKHQRRRILWTPEEEEMLRMGVKKFAPEANKNMPWRKILQMGEKVFQRTRTPADLKDKWRNMPKEKH